MQFRSSIKWRIPPSFSVFIGLFSGVYTQASGIWLGCLLLPLGFYHALEFNSTKFPYFAFGRYLRDPKKISLLLVTCVSFVVGSYLGYGHGHSNINVTNETVKVGNSSKGTVKFHGYCISVRHYKYYQKVIGRDFRTHQKYMIMYNGNHEITPGNFLKTDLRLGTYRRAMFPGLYNQEFDMGDVTLGYTKSIIIKPKFMMGRYEYADMLAVLANRVRHAAAIKIDTHVHNNYDIIKAMTIGRLDTVNDKKSNVIKGMGVSHLLAISGLHIGILMAVVAAILITLSTKLGIDLRYTYFLSILICGFYVFIAGLSASALRAGTMTIITLIMLMCRSYVSVQNCLFITACALIIAHPAYVLNPGYQLSYLAMTAIVLCGKRWIMTLITIPSLTTAVVAFHFGQWQLIGIIANIVYIPLASAVLLLTMLGLMLPEAIAHYLFTIADILTQVMVTDYHVSSIHASMPSYTTVLMIAISSLSMIHRNTKIPLIGMAVSLVGTWMTLPDIKINNIYTNKELLVWEANHNRYQYYGRKNSYTMKYWQARFGKLGIVKCKSPCRLIVKKDGATRAPK